jgi:hypothetical protein
MIRGSRILYADGTSKSLSEYVQTELIVVAGVYSGTNVER